MGKRPDPRKGTLTSTRIARGERPRAGKGWVKGAQGRPPKRFTYDPATVHGQRESARARAAARLDDCLELCELMVRTGLGVLRELHPAGKAPRDVATSEAALAGKVVELSRNGTGETWTSETREERLPYGGLDWGDVRWAADYLADRGGLSRRTETAVEGGAKPKLVLMTGWIGPDGQVHAEDDDAGAGG